jgi:aminopeptidase N
MARFLLAAFLSAIQLAGDTYPRQLGIDAQHYIFKLTLSDSTDEITGEATAEFRFVRDGVAEVALDLAASMKVSEVSSSGARLEFTHPSDRLVIPLASPPHSGDLRKFTILYHGTPTSGLRIGTNKYHDRTFFSQNWPDLARQWLPIIDHPYDKATSEFLITAPAKYQVVANGLLQEETDLGDGRRLTHWKQSVPIASWLNAIGVAQFASRHFAPVHGVPLETWLDYQDREAGIVTFEGPAREALEFYIDHIGPFPYEKLANVEAAGVSGGMEHASAIFYGEKSVTNEPATNLVAHEIAHQWFGDSVTEKDWDDVWLSEGFATYFTLLCTEHYEGREAFVAGLKHSRDVIFATEKKIPGVAVRHDNLSDMKKVLNQLVYHKGGWTLHMLRRQIGTNQFWAGIRDYYQRYRDASASTDDFRRVMEENSGQDLRWFFHQWLDRAGSPVVEGIWRYDAVGKTVGIELSQKQEGEAYRLPLEIAVAGRIEQIEMTQKTQRFEFITEKETSSVVLDPDTWLLLDAKLVAAP